MRLSAVLVPVVVALATGRAVTTDGSAAGSSNVSSSSAERAAEVRRIQSHFDSVLTELPARDVSALSAPQRRERAALLVTLRAYRDEGVFPHNYDFPGQAMPYFVDRKTETLCAVAHLLASTGRRDIVDRIARTNNNVWVPQLAGDTAFARWLDAHGLTLAEAARIQVPYAGGDSPIVSALGSRSTAYTVGAAVTIAGSAAASLWNGLGNRDGRHALATVVGMTTGVVGLGFGAAALGDPDAPTLAGALSAAAGGVSAFIATRGLMRHRSILAARREEERRRSVARVVVSPIIPVSARSGAGVAVRVSF